MAKLPVVQLGPRPPHTADQAPPWRTGWLSIALSSRSTVWIDGHAVGKAPIAYLRLPAGPHKVKIAHKGKPTRSFLLQVKPDLHLSLGRQKNKKLGIYFVRTDQSEVHIYRYPKGGGAVIAEHRPPGPYCMTAKRCLFLTPGEQLYVQADGRYTIMAARYARTAVRPYRDTGRGGYLNIYSYPPGALFLNQRMYGLTPMARLPLPEGLYKGRVYNGFLRVTTSFTLPIKRGKTLRKHLYLCPKGGSHLRLTSRRPAQIFIDGQYRGWTPARALMLTPGQHRITLHPHKGKAVQTTAVLRADRSHSLYLP